MVLSRVEGKGLASPLDSEQPRSDRASSESRGPSTPPLLRFAKPLLAQDDRRSAGVPPAVRRCVPPSASLKANQISPVILNP